MGGQACVLYGAAEFSRDIDLAILSDEDNFIAVKRVLAELQANRIAVPPFELTYLQKGHAVHFRCQHPDVLGLRIDIMSTFRGMENFGILWGRKSEIYLADDENIFLMSLPDLVKAKKTQRDKDWPMIRRLVEANYSQFMEDANPARIEFWLTELRTASLLIEVARLYPDAANVLKVKRNALAVAMLNDLQSVNNELVDEERLEREADKLYWKPLRAEIENLRKLERKESRS